MIYAVPVTSVDYCDGLRIHRMYTFTRLSDARDCLYHFDVNPTVGCSDVDGIIVDYVSFYPETVQYYYSYDECVELNDSRYVSPVDEHMFPR